MRKPTETMTMESVQPKLHELLKHPEDLDKISFLKTEFVRKKGAIDAQLKTGIKSQNDRTQTGMDELKDAQRKLQEIKEEMMKIDRLCTEAKNMVSDVPNLGRIATISRNFQTIEQAKAQLESFNPRVDNLENLLRLDGEELDNQPNLLEIHKGLTELRDFRDEAMDQIKVTKDRSMENTLVDHLSRLDDVIEDFDRNFGYACMNMIDFVQADNRSILVRLALVIEKEEQSDKKAQAMQDARQQYADLASRFKSINISSERQLRGYKEKFLKTIEFVAQQRFDETEPAFLEDPDKLAKQMKWFFNNLFAVKQGMTGTMPKKWKIYDTYTHIYHALMHNFLIKFVDDPELSPPHMLAISDWVPEYYKRMAKLGWQMTDLSPHVIDERDSELIREYRQLIVRAVDSWMDRMHSNDRLAFTNRQQDYIESNEYGYFRTKTLGDLWRMLHEQILHAGSSNRTDVVEGVVDAMFSALKQRQQFWQSAISDEVARYKSPTTSTTTTGADSDSISSLQDWLTALANDQLFCADDRSMSSEETTASTSCYLSRFQRDLEPLVTPSYFSSRAVPESDTIRNGFIDLATYSLSSFAAIIIATDFHSTLSDFFTPKWYNETGMRSICLTIVDYLGDYKSTLQPSLLDVLAEEIGDQLLIAYLSCIRNKGVKFRRGDRDQFVGKIRDDVLTAFEFFESLNQQPSDSSAGGGGGGGGGDQPALVPTFDFPELKRKYRAIDFFVRLLDAEKAAVGGVFVEFRREFPDVQVGWVEAVLRSRDDFEKAMVNGVKAKAGEMLNAGGAGGGGMETSLMGRVK